MQFSSANSVYLASGLIFVLKFFPFLSFANPQFHEAGLICGQNIAPINTSYNIPRSSEVVEEIESEVMGEIESLVIKNGWGLYAGNKTNISFYALAQCYQDLAPVDCYFCYLTSRGIRHEACGRAASGRVYMDGCFLRFDNYNFFDESVDTTKGISNCSSRSAGVLSVEDVENFGKNVVKLIDKVTSVALKNGGFAVKGLNGVFGLAQCWKTLSEQGCKECLTKASRNAIGCLPSREGRGMDAGCYLRYSTVKFYNDPPKTIAGPSTWGKRVAIGSSVVAFSMLSLFAAYAFYARFKKSIQEQRKLARISHAYNKSYLYFKYEILEKATNYFDPRMKIGQGGAGSVYIGTLPDGKVIAVKRLFFSTSRWVEEFFNEVDLINGIQHKNLVKFLGCSIEGPESLLVYEFVPNKSLDHYLFDENRIKILSWKERFQIIIGTAEGIAFLHGGAGIRIVHRDIKSSNVLLDEDFSPKVADFGLARHFAEDRTHLSTELAGTLGYMAPEYLVKGQLTEKADVYSFGILVLEIVCGRKHNYASKDDSGSLLQTVWTFYQTDKLEELVDPCLKGNFPALEAWNVLKIGLLCGQASATSRPSMVEVVQMVTVPNCAIPEPNQPPFLNSNSSFPAANPSRS
ncbi:cysteine-rich receptor-like protein kinase 42 isoform X1 [Coffea arabica]|uniref:Cysteine-rich receptor-like protein kinase 42 isoform X1 n=2 Tax=Coffea arabica TaxID=13443 RepID=A0A6P6T5L8_COFAR|nr:cysteine-rich receptor-like protein kinase 42 isoform X1 [Coffea arabica]